jgi:SAM-dependent methyltransferase
MPNIGEPTVQTASLRAIIPWWMRIGAKVVLSRLPISYSTWRRVNLFAHGDMVRPAYALDVFRRHFSNSGLIAGSPFVALELGPGDSLASAVIARAHGATHTHMVDEGNFATDDIDSYRILSRYLRSEGFDVPEFDDIRDVTDVLRDCAATYHCGGLRSLRALPTASVDFIWSNAVLEHVRRDAVPEVARELRRVLRAGGVCCHQVDLRDHLGGALNNLRIPSAWWEKEWMARSGFYTNRLRKSELLQIFEEAGFSAKVIAVETWDESPISRDALAREFRNLSDEDLRIQHFLAALYPS